MEEVFISVSYGDKIAVAPNLDGELAIKIQNTAFDDPARWLSIVMTGHSRLQAIDELIDALTRIRQADQ